MPTRTSKYWFMGFLCQVGCLVLAACTGTALPQLPSATASIQALESTNTASPSSLPSPTSQPSTATDSPTIESTLDSDCYQVEFVEDVTVRDGALMRPGEIFLKVWRIENTGQCAWEGTLLLVFEKGVRMRSPDETPANFYSPGSELELTLSDNEWVEGRVFHVEPGQSVDLALVLQAPFDPGSHRAYFLLLDPFGHEMYQLFTVIQVMEAPRPGEWSGEWAHWMPSFFEDDDARLYLDQIDRDLTGFFYLPDGRLLLLSGLISEDGLFASGLWGEPWTDGSQFEWSLTQPDVIQGSFLSASMPEGDWCAVRGDLTLVSDNCLLTEP